MMEMINTEHAGKKELIRAFGRLTVSEVGQFKFPSVAGLKRAYGEQQVETVLSIVLLEASTSFDEPLDTTEAEEIAVEVVATYPNLSLEDCFVALQELKHSKIFGKLSANKILRQFGDYFARKTQHAASKSLNEHLARKEGRQDPNNPFYATIYSAIAKLNDLKGKHGKA